MNDKEQDAPLRPFLVGEWWVRPDLNQLQRGDQHVRVQPRLIQVLRQLALCAGQTVTRETLLDQAWSRRMVNDEVLSRTIADLRAALGDDARQPRYLLTISKVGYRLIAAVHWPETADTLGSGPVAAEPPPHPQGPPIALLLALLAGLLLLAWWALQRPMRNGADADTPRRERLLRAQPLSSEPGWELTPRLAPDGQLLAWSESAAGSDAATLRLRSRDGRIPSP